MRQRIPALALAALSAALVIAVPAPAQAAPPEVTPENVAAFFDSYLPQLLDGSHIPGAAVSVVSGGEQVYQGGFGVSDVDSGRPVDPEDTAFFIASVTKLFTGSAVMQQVERGHLDLDTDVNTYLKTFQIPDTYPGRPITMRNLLTHTAGFDGLILATGATDPADVLPLGEYVETYLPDRIRPPGETSSYDNFAVSLAGYVVETVSGTPFADYIRDNVFAPLGMTMSSLAQPAPEALTAALSKGYTPVDGEQTVVGSQYGFDAPAGAGTISTAADMSRFMLAHLAGGTGILSPESAAMMHERQFGNHPALPGICLIFMEQNLGGQRIIEHGGDSPGFHSGLWLFPEKDTGLFLTYNGDGDAVGDPRVDLSEAFTEHFFPAAPADGPAPVPNDTGGLAGSYQIARMSHTDATRALAVITTVTVGTNEDGTIDIGDEIYTPVGADVYRADDGVYAGFRRDAGGDAAYLFFSDQQAETYERLAWYADPDLHLVVLAALGLALLSLVWWLVSAVRRREPAAPIGARLARVTVAVFFAGVIGALATLLQAAGDQTAMVVAVLNGGSALLNRIPALLTMSALAGAAGVVFAVLAWRRGWWTRPLRVHYSLVLLCALAFLAVAGYYQLLGWPVTARL